MRSLRWMKIFFGWKGKEREGSVVVGGGVEGIEEGGGEMSGVLVSAAEDGGEFVGARVVVGGVEGLEGERIGGGEDGPLGAEFGVESVMGCWGEDGLEAAAGWGAVGGGVVFGDPASFPAGGGWGGG